ncbi:hypothetical protein [Vibrio vulnificus YJ016]|uniref:Uncharacterized protein n=1 Tax=Vibrio vulnificus (strain YJ016) TaxID=196600 RepID=Q7MPD1_VIBVY|nr:hypothetical protein FORC16_0259 [Vibrio vulnificus]BAC93197.1 hypothetical protein [Vibrio vulnificus YJ016]
MKQSACNSRRFLLATLESPTHLVYSSACLRLNYHRSAQNKEKEITHEFK